MIRFPEWKLSSKRVFLRADLNVPLQGSIIVDDFRLLAIKPTLDYLLSKGSSVILATHIDRPQGYEEDLSTKPLVDWFSSRGYKTAFLPYQSNGFAKEDHCAPGHLYILDNLRFHSGEQNGDESFAKMLRGMADYYVNDAFGVAHETSSSTIILPALFAASHRSSGFLIQTECVHLSFLKQKEKNLTIIIGGGKGNDKIPYLENALKQPHTTILVGPAIAFTFLKAIGYDVGNSLVNDSMIDTARHLLKETTMGNRQLIIPLDIVSQVSNKQLMSHAVNNFPQNAVGVTIGPRTLELYKKYIDKSDLIFFNCAMGFANQPETLVPTKELMNYVSESKTYRVAGGGDTVSLLRSFSLQPKFDFCSSGGGSALAFITNSPMPGLEAL